MGPDADGRFLGATTGLSGTTVGLLGTAAVGLVGIGAAGFFGTTAGFLGAAVGGAGKASASGDTTPDAALSVLASSQTVSFVSSEGFRAVILGFAALTGGRDPVLGGSAFVSPEPLVGFADFTGGGGAALALAASVEGCVCVGFGGGAGGAVSVLPAASLSTTETDARFFCTGGGTGLAC